MQAKATGQKLRTGMMLSVLALLLALVYLLVRTALFILTDTPWPDRGVGLLLLGAETFILVHGVGYFLEVIHVASRRHTLAAQDTEPAALTTFPPTAIIVSSFKEPLEVVEETLISFRNQTYPNKRLYFLDDTRYDLPGDDPEAMRRYRQAIDDLCRRLNVNLFRRRWRGAKAGMINDFLHFLDGKPDEGFEFHPFSRDGDRGTEQYIIVFDADAIPLPHFTSSLVARIEKDPRLAFVQTPQYYSNFETNRVARAAGLQQVVFYEYICEGKSISDAMFCCGTNVIFRREALLDVGGFDESSVTEDFATSLKFHLRGWKSAYLSEVLTFQLGPEDLGGYFKQQFRWALGTVGLLRQIVPLFLSHPGRLTPVKWWEYLLSSTYYFIGPVFLIMVTCPLLYLFFDIPVLFARPDLHAIFFLPYLVLTLATFYWTLQERHYRPRDLILGQFLMAITFPVYLKASILALLGVRGTFVVTPKGRSEALPLRDIWPQVSLAALCLAAIVWGANRLLFHDGPPAALLVNLFWTSYHFAILASVFYFNEPDRKGDAP